MSKIIQTYTEISCCKIERKLAHWNCSKVHLCTPYDPRSSFPINGLAYFGMMCTKELKLIPMKEFTPASRKKQVSNGVALVGLGFSFLSTKTTLHA